jgi:hypothetical protein
MESPQSIREFAATKNIEHLLHFTKINNLESILILGLIPREALDAAGWNYQYADSMRLDGKRENNCLSIGFPNWQMFYKLRQSDPSATWVVLEIDAIPILEDARTSFVPDNAAAYRMKGQEASGLKGLSRLYDDCFHPTKNRPKYLPPGYPSNSQAEVLFRGEISPHLIQGVCGVSVSDCLKIRKILERTSHAAQANLREHYFEIRTDYAEKDGWRRK